MLYMGLLLITFETNPNGIAVGYCLNRWGSIPGNG
jgi:hypothetical protein